MEFLVSTIGDIYACGFNVLSYEYSKPLLTILISFILPILSEVGTIETSFFNDIDPTPTKVGISL